MIGPSSGTGGIPDHELSENQSRAARKRIFDDLDIETFCEEVQNSRKRYQFQEMETPIELIASNEMIGDTAALFSSVEESPVTRLEVLLVDGTNCTWTTVSELESQQNIAEIAPSPSTSSSSPEHRREQVIQVEETGYQIEPSYWEPVVTIPSTNLQQSKSAPSSSNQYQQQFDDQETGNLSWLLDFKLDPFIEAADDRSTSSNYNYNGSKTKVNGRSYGSTYVNDAKRSYNENGSLHQDTIQNYQSPDKRNFVPSRCNGPKKPPFTYTELIEHALRERGELTVSAIYQWISEHFPYYKNNDDRWKNSVRHNLSINPHFRKGSKAPHGAGHLWAIANRSGDIRPRQIINTSIGNSSMKQIVKNSLETENPPKNISQMNFIDEVEAATASITQQSSEEETENIVNSVTLEHCAEQILSGIKKEVEVQYLVPMMMSNSEHNSEQAQEIHYPVKESDFLNPVSKEVVAEECGLISEGYLVTDINPTALGLNMVEPEIITPENLFGEELNFQFYELSSPSQIQSA
ncbi:uncharacterized protein LOC128896686 [Hylaeus anthracinus]|uniref:uncharacterized protein LOC128881833 n=1 Tax=Hylaeus volcanicus TaxID=313075 RepID=UPI0023B7E2EB|nr:uncharacterized protein LOC128881833 [Hylaeus volcanicus]XP_053989176.1 uncharacterized protein LOC128881833 [Hylaeus volcanicus]XP_054016065.1 uncharacterized protein LOC128896686 [Hylaeus anthracinus]XP_054016066.1 uncharacterized protein LOC128896686 [Hylaeus anthracinus]